MIDWHSLLIVCAWITGFGVGILIGVFVERVKPRRDDELVFPVGTFRKRTERTPYDG